MIEIKTQKNYLIEDETKDGYCFKSFPNQVISHEELAAEFKNFNSSLTEPDALSMFNILDTLVCRYVANGYIVKLPFCKIYNRATGTTGSLYNSFVPGEGNHKFSTVMEITDKAKASMIKNVAYKQLEPELVCRPKAFEVVSLAVDGKDCKNLTVKKGAPMRLHGKNLKADLTDEKQGVFLVSDDNLETRIPSFTRYGTAVADFAIPADVPAGEYTIYVRTKNDAGVYRRAVCDDVITVLE